MQAVVQFDESHRCFRVLGDVSFKTVVRLRNEGIRLMRSHKETVIFDFSGVKKTDDSSGLLLLLAWARQANQSGQRLCFRNISQQLLDVAGVCGLSDMIASLTEKNNDNEK